MIQYLHTVIAFLTMFSQKDIRFNIKSTIGHCVDLMGIKLGTP